MRKILAVAHKEFRQASRDPISLAMLLGVPTLMLLLFGFALSFDVRHVALSVQDRELGAASRHFIASFTNSTYFDLVAALGPGDDPEALLRRGAVKAVLVIPEKFGADLAAGRAAPVQFLLDGTDSNTASTLLGYARALAAEENASLLAYSLDRAPGSARRALEAAIDYQSRVWFNPELRSTQFLVPGLIGIILMLTAVISTALSVVREKERGTMEQIQVTPLRPLQLLAGKTLPYLVISLVATAIILVSARVLFGVVVKGSYFDLFGATLVFLLGALGLGLLISSAAESQAMAFQAGAVSATLPTIFLSGFIFPLRSMPEALQAVSYLVPARYYLVILRGVILKGAGLATYLDQVGFLAAYAVLMLALAAIRLSRGEVR
jgi:ABC-2 type transport system permease protein